MPSGLRSPARRAPTLRWCVEPARASRCRTCQPDRATCFLTALWRLTAASAERPPGSRARPCANIVEGRWGAPPRRPQLTANPLCGRRDGDHGYLLASPLPCRMRSPRLTQRSKRAALPDSCVGPLEKRSTALVSSAASTRWPAWVATGLLALLGAAGCGLLGPSDREYTIQVDSIEAPLVVGPTESGEVRFLGGIGPSGCYSLAEVRTARSPQLLRLEFRGRYRDALCTQEPVRLDHSLTVSPPLADPFTISVVQPSGPALEATIRVQ